MTAIALNGRGFSQMADGGDSNGWTAIIAIASGFIGSGVTFAWKLADQAASSGRISGVTEAQLTALIVRVTTLEADHRLMATREDMRGGFAEMKQQAREDTAELKHEVNALRALIYEARGQRAPGA